ncbi:MAG: asparagine synthase (glutamine-hydrolyzing) [Gammaproteobacteria bacterium]|nr:asparagine synthase (glutamine-hydrolyzing) [Gammaproteobacteria bacterium]
MVFLLIGMWFLNPCLYSNMCGITGFFNTFSDAENHHIKISKMVSMIEHRGPDELAYAIDEIMAMATARLSVIDINHGQQPMRDQSNRYWICYNGELYNFIELREELIKYGVRFETSSDTEVVLKAYIYWGLKAFERFNGGYAIVIYDSLEKNIVLVRDRFGKRPLYYSHHKKGLIFASEVKCFLPINDFELSFDENSLANIFSFWTPLPEESPYKGIKQVPPGGYLKFNIKGELLQEQYYQLTPMTSSVSDIKEAQFQVEAALEKSVDLRLRSDVEVGSYLSGGLDSSIISLLASKKLNTQLKTFSIRFESEQFDESDEQLAMANTIDSEHHSVCISDKDIVDNFSKAIYFSEVPVFRTAFVPMYILSSLVKQNGVKVVLTGEGADEGFLGYNIFKELLIRKQWNNYDSVVSKHAALKKLYPYLEHFQDNIKIFSALFDNFSSNQNDPLFSHRLRFHNSKFSQRLLNNNWDANSHLIKYMDARINSSNGKSMAKAQWLEFNTLLHGYLLSTQGDRMSFSHGVEARLPFMDHNVIECANRLHLNLKIADGYDEKHILKKVFSDRLPKNIIKKNKQPYRAPDASAFLSVQDAEWRDLLNDSNNIADMGFLDTAFVSKFISKLMKSSTKTISQRENQTFIFLLSLLSIHNQFMSPKYRNISVSPKVACRFDLR